LREAKGTKETFDQPIPCEVHMFDKSQIPPPPEFTEATNQIKSYKNHIMSLKDIFEVDNFLG